MENGSLSRTIRIATLAFFTVSASLLLNNLCLYNPDSATYLTLASSMANGKGYRDIGSPGEPAHLKYPPAYPVLLIPAALLCHRNIILAGKAVNILISLGALIMLHRLLRRLFSHRRSALILAITAFNPVFIQHSAEALSESAYLLFSCLSLLLIISSTETDRLMTDSAAGITSGLAFLTRIIGGGLCIAGLLFYWGRGSRRKAIVFLSAFLIVTIPWALRNFLGVSRAGGLDAWGYWGSMVLSGAPEPSLWGTLSDGARYYATEIPHLLYPFLYLPKTELGNSLSPAFSELIKIPSLITASLACVTLILVAAGFFCAVRNRGLRPLTWYLLFYIVIIILYPARQLRLLIPAIPFLWCFFLEGGEATFRLATAQFPHFVWSRIRSRLMYAFSGSYCCAAIILTVFLILTNLSYLGLPGLKLPVAERFKYDLSGASAWLRENTPIESVILSDNTELFLLSGRKVVGGGQYSAVLGEFERSLRTNKVSYIVAATRSGVSIFHRLIANALMFDFKKVASFPQILIHQVTPRATPRTPYAEHYTRVIDLISREALGRPGDPVVHKELGYFYFREGKLDLAATEFLRALELDPACSVTWFNLGSVYLDTKRYDEAITAFNKTLAVRSADLITSLVEPSMKIAKLKKEIGKNPDDPRNYERYVAAASIYFHMGESLKALEELRRASKLQPGLADPYVLMGDCYARIGQKDKARKSYQKAIKLNPAEDRARRRLTDMQAQS